MSRSGNPETVESIELPRREVRNILLIRTSAIGDVLHVLPALEALRLQFPAARFSWFVEPLGGSVLEGHPHIDDLIVFDRKRWTRNLLSPTRFWGSVRDFSGLVARMRRSKFDLVIDFQNNFRSGLAVACSGARWRVSFHPQDCREFGGWLFANLRAPPGPLSRPRVLKNLHLVRYLGWTGDVPEAVVPVPEEQREWARRFVDDLPGEGPLVTVHPAVSAWGFIKQWPVRHYNVLLDRLTRERKVRVVVTWGPGEEAIAREVARGTAAVVAPATNPLLRLAALLAESQLVLAADTGCLHLAAALGKPLVGLYGPKGTQTYAPYPLRGRLVQSNVPCSPCRLRLCSHRICMDDISPLRVLESIDEVLEEEAIAEN